jgi:hypothetical protein
MGRAQLKEPNGLGPNGIGGGPKWAGPNRHGTVTLRLLNLKVNLRNTDNNNLKVNLALITIIHGTVATIKLVFFIIGVDI